MKPHPWNSTSTPYPAGRGKEFPLSTQLAAVDNGREVVTASGSIQEPRSTGSLGNRAARYVRMLVLWNVHVQLAVWAVKALVVQVPEPEIYLPAGTELTLTLSAPVIGGVVNASAREPRALTEQERESLIPVTAALPERTSAGSSGQTCRSPECPIDRFAGRDRGRFHGGWMEASASGIDTIESGERLECGSPHCLSGCAHVYITSERRARRYVMAKGLQRRL